MYLQCNCSAAGSKPKAEAASPYDCVWLAELVLPSSPKHESMSCRPLLLMFAIVDACAGPAVAPSPRSMESRTSCTACRQLMRVPALQLPPSPRQRRQRMMTYLWRKAASPLII